MGKQQSSKSRSEPSISFNKSKLRTEFLIDSRSEHPCSNSYDVRSKSSTSNGYTFGEGRRYMYDSYRDEIGSIKLGPGEYYDSKSSSCLGLQMNSQNRSKPSYTIHSRSREPSVISAMDARYLPNITFSRRGTRKSPGPGQYNVTRPNTSRRIYGSSMKRGFIKSLVRPSWCAGLEDKSNQEDRTNRPLTSSMGSQDVSQNVSFRSHQFGKSYRVSPDLWLSSPEIYPSSCREMPGVGQYHTRNSHKLSNFTSTPIIWILKIKEI